MSLSQSECAPNKPIQPANALGDHSLRQQDRDTLKADMDAWEAENGEPELIRNKTPEEVMADVRLKFRQNGKPIE